MRQKILHVCNLDKFIPPFVDFIEQNFDLNDQFFWLNGDHDSYPTKLCRSKYEVKRSKIGKIKGLLKLAQIMHTSERIILHNLFNQNVVLLLFFMPWLLKRCYWVVWGADLYVYQFGERNWKWRLREFFRRPVIKNMGFFSTTVPGDYLMAKDWYGTNAKWIHNLMYPSHLYTPIETISCKEKKGETIYIQIGNSADPANNHFEIIDELEKYKDRNIKVYCPLSYGSAVHKNNVINYGKKVLGKKFIPMTNFMRIREYSSHMACIDIAIFNHERQQAMGNTIGLLSLGKKVILREGVTPFSFFKGIGLNVYTINDDNLLVKLEEGVALENISKMKNYFNADRLKANWMKIFYDK